MKDTRFFKQAQLVLQILPVFMREKAFALKGGTAINFFIRNLPRLSVDIDFTYTPLQERKVSLKEISESLEKAASSISQQIAGVRIQRKMDKSSKTTTGLFVTRKNVSVKIEPNLILRGMVFPPMTRKLCNKAQELFEQSFSSQILSFEDIYGGKICAALDRQHPRDLFDMKILFENEGISEDIRKAFIVYLLSHSRPMVELLNPNFIDISNIFENEFQGMTIDPVSLSDLLETRETLVKYVKTNLTEKERRFILSIKEVNPQWDLMGIEHIKDLPAVQWKLKNLDKIEKKKHQQAIAKLKSYLEL